MQNVHAELGINAAANDEQLALGLRKGVQPARRDDMHCLFWIMSFDLDCRFIYFKVLEDRSGSRKIKATNTDTGYYSPLVSE